MVFSFIDDAIIAFARKRAIFFARLALFLCYFWFGLLKVLDKSAASGLVTDLLRETLPFIEPHAFIFLFGLFEMVIGLLFLKRGVERIVIPLFLIHIALTFVALVVLPVATWSGFGVPTLEGQYIFKNFALIACVLVVASRLKTSDEK